MRTIVGAVAYGTVAAFCFILSSACSMGGQAQPAWVQGASSEYPSAQFLTGLGQGYTRSVADDQAYAAVARIFSAQVSSQSKDWESYLLVEQRGQGRDERRLTLDTVTQVSTDKILENVRIVERWYDSKKAVFYALAGMNRLQAESVLLERMAELDQAVRADVDEVRRTSDNLAKVRGLRRAARNLVLREAYNADLRVIRLSGQGVPSTYQLHELTRQLEAFLSENLELALTVSGDHVEPVRRALTEGLIKQGLKVVLLPAGESQNEGELSGRAPELLVRGLVRVWPIDVKAPYFKYVRWCSEFEIIDRAGQRVVGAISRGGKEGHLSDREATAKVVRIMQQDMMSEVAKAIAAHVFGEIELPAEAVRPAGCPREESERRPIAATH